MQRLHFPQAGMSWQLQAVQDLEQIDTERKQLKTNRALEKCTESVGSGKLNRAQIQDRTHRKARALNACRIDAVGHHIDGGHRAGCQRDGTYHDRNHDLDHFRDDKEEKLMEKKYINQNPMIINARAEIKRTREKLAESKVKGQFKKSRDLQKRLNMQQKDLQAAIFHLIDAGWVNE